MTEYIYDTLPAPIGHARVVFAGHDKLISCTDPRVIRYVAHADPPYGGKIYTTAHVSEFDDYVQLSLLDDYINNHLN